MRVTISGNETSPAWLDADNVTGRPSYRAAAPKKAALFELGALIVSRETGQEIN